MEFTKLPALTALLVSLMLATAIGSFAQSSCSVLSYGAKGDCTTDDTAAFQKAADTCGSFFIPRQPDSSRCYRVSGIKLRSGVTVTMEDLNTVLWPVSAATSYVFEIAGKSMESQISHTTIRNGMIWAPFAMMPKTAGIRITYANHISLEDVIINGFYDDIFSDNTFYLYLIHVGANGGLHTNLWHQHSDVQHGPYFGGPLYIENSTLDSCQCSAASIWVQDIAVVNITDTDIVGIEQGQGLHADSSNGRPGTPSDFPGGIHIHGDTFDSIGSEAIAVYNYLKSDMEGSWLSSGRTKKTACMEIGDGVRDFSISDSHFFWCGTDGLEISNAANIKVSTSTFSGSPRFGIHNISGTSSFFFGNSCDAKTYNGNGSTTQSFCINEEQAAHDNSYLMNDGSGTTHGNSYHGVHTEKNLPPSSKK